MHGDLIYISSLGLLVTAIFVVVLATWVAWAQFKQHRIDETFIFASALWMGWLVTFYLRAAYLYGSYDWLEGSFLMQPQAHWTIPAALFIAILSGLLHIRVLTWRKDHKIWKYATLAVSAAMLIAYWGA